jgi:solute carrier family 30 (zinc transporter), member 2
LGKNIKEEGRTTEDKTKGSGKSKKEESQNYNMRAAVIHILGDMVQSLGVITAAVLICINEEWKIADPICTFIFSVLVLFTTIPIMRDCTKILMEGTPDEIDVEKLFN